MRRKADHHDRERPTHVAESSSYRRGFYDLLVQRKGIGYSFGSESLRNLL